MQYLDRQPVLSAPGLVLRPLRAGDWDALYAIARDPAIWAMHPANDRWQEPVFRAFFEQGLASAGALVAIDPAHGGIIGSSRYDLARAGADEVEIGWTFLSRAYWGGRINALMKQLMIAHALSHAGRVIFVVGEHNRRSCRAMEKIGGVLTERIVDGSQGRHVVYAIDRAGFATGPLTRAAAGAVVR